MNGDNSQASRCRPWTNVYGVARALLATCTLTSLLFHNSDQLFRPTGITARVLSGGELWSRLSIFGMFSDSHLDLGRWISVAILLVVIAGWRPRVTGVLHWWVAYSFAVSCMLVEGGDQIVANLALLLIPVTLTDSRGWHWQAPTAICTALRGRITSDIAWSAIIVVRVQIAVVYLHAAVGKLKVQEWTNGTALYYWFSHSVFGGPKWLQPIVDPIVTNAIGVTTLTWSVIALELLLAGGLFVERRYRPLLLYLALIFHVGILFVHGLASFSIGMAGALVLYLRPVDECFSFPRLEKWVGSISGYFKSIQIRRRHKHGREIAWATGVRDDRQ